MSKNSENEMLGERIRSRRVEKGHTQKSLADALTVHEKTVFAWERGDGCKSDFIPVLCEILDCDTEYLFGSSSTPHKEMADISEVTGLSTKSVERLMKGLNARKKEEHLPFDEHLIAFSDTIKAIDILIQNSFGNQLLALLFIFINGDIDRIRIMGKPNADDTLDDFKGKETKEDFMLEVYDKSMNSTRYYDANEFISLMRDSTFTEIQETIFKLRDEVIQGGKSNGEHR